MPRQVWLVESSGSREKWQWWQLAGPSQPILDQSWVILAGALPQAGAGMEPAGPRASQEEKGWQRGADDIGGGHVGKRGSGDPRV